MTVETFPDVEGAMRTWLRAQPAIAAHVASRVFLGVPDTTTYPLITITRIGGVEDRSDAPIDQAALRFTVWGQLRDRKGCTDCYRALRGVLHSMAGPTPLDANTRGFGATIDSVLYLPDPADNRPRYVIHSRITAISI